MLTPERKAMLENKYNINVGTNKMQPRAINAQINQTPTGNSQNKVSALSQKYNITPSVSSTKSTYQAPTDFNEWSMSQENAPYSKSLQEKGGLTGVLGAVLNPVEQVARYGMGAAYVLPEAVKAARGDVGSQQELGSGNIPFFSKNQEKALRYQPTDAVYNPLKDPNVSEGIRQGANVTSLILPAAKGWNAPVAGAIRGASSAYGQTNADMTAGEQAKQVLTGAATGSVIEGVTSNLGKVKKYTGEKIQQYGKDYGIKGWGRPQTIAEFEQRFGKEEANKIIGKLNLTRDQAGLDTLDEALSSVQDQYDNIVKNSNIKVDTNLVYKNVLKRAEELRATNIDVNVKKADQMMKELDNWFQTKPGFRTDASALTTRRKMYGDLVKQYQFDPANKTIYQEMRDAFQDAIYQGTKNYGEAKTLGKELNKLITFKEKIMVPAARKGTTVSPLGVGEISKMIPASATFAITSNPVLAAATYLGGKALSSPKGVSLTSRALRKSGELITKSTGINKVLPQVGKFGNIATQNSVFRRK